MIVLALLLLAAASASSQPSPEARPAGGASIERVAWLQGCWESQAPNRTVEENWMPPRGKSMIGVGRTVRDGALVEYELTVIREQDGKLSYEAHPSGQPAATFQAREVTDDRVVFENPEHDFPQKVGYKREGAEALTGWIEGTMKGKSRRVEFPYRRIPCPGK